MPPPASGMRGARVQARKTCSAIQRAAILAQHTAETIYFEVEVLPLVGLEEPGVPGTAPEVAPEPVD